MATVDIGTISLILTGLFVILLAELIKSAGKEAFSAVLFDNEEKKMRKSIGLFFIFIFGLIFFFFADGIASYLNVDVLVVNYLSITLLAIPFIIILLKVL